LKKIHYKNNFGTLEFEIVGPYIENAKHSSRHIQEDLCFSLDSAEKIALINTNRDLQFCVTSDHKRMFLVHHINSSTAALCKVSKLDYLSDIEPSTELAKPRFWSIGKL